MTGLCEDVIYLILKYIPDQDILNLNTAVPELVDFSESMEKRVEKALSRTYGPFWKIGEILINRIIGYVDDQSLQILDLTAGNLSRYSKEMKNRVNNFVENNRFQCSMCLTRYKNDWQVKYHLSCRKCKCLIRM